MGMQLISNFFNFTSRVFDGLLRLQVSSRGANQEEVPHVGMSVCYFWTSTVFFSKLPCYGGWRILVEEYHSSKGRICSVQTVAHSLNLPVLKTHFGIAPTLWLKVKVACFLPLAELFCLNPYRWLCGSAFNWLTASSIYIFMNSALNDSLWIEPHRVSAVSFPQHAITILIWGSCKLHVFPCLGQVLHPLPLVHRPTFVDQTVCFLIGLVLFFNSMNLDTKLVVAILGQDFTRCLWSLFDLIFVTWSFVLSSWSTFFGLMSHSCLHLVWWYPHYAVECIALVHGVNDSSQIKWCWSSCTSFRSYGAKYWEQRLKLPGHHLQAGDEYHMILLIHPNLLLQSTLNIASLNFHHSPINLQLHLHPPRTTMFVTDLLLHLHQIFYVHIPFHHQDVANVTIDPSNLK